MRFLTYESDEDVWNVMLGRHLKLRACYIPAIVSSVSGSIEHSIGSIDRGRE